MSHVSRFKLSKKLKEGIWEKMLLLFARSFGKSTSKGNELLDGLLTDTEKEMLSKRLMAFWMLNSGWSVLEVSEKLFLSTATVYKLSGYLIRDDKFTKLIDDYFPRKLPKFSKDRKELGGFLDAMFEGYRERWKLHK